MKSLRVEINKADDEGNGSQSVFRLEEIEPQFVSLVTAGANRQKKFQVVKAEDGDGTGVQTDKDAGEGSHGDGGTNGHNGTQNETEANGDGDFSDWLDGFGTTVDVALNDATIDAYLSAPSGDAGVTGDEAPQQRVGKQDQLGSTTLEKAKAEVAAEVKKRKELEAKLAESEKRAAALAKKLDTVTGERDKYRSRYTTIKRNSVGGTTSMLTGMLDGKVAKGKGSDDEHVPWAGGEDMAAGIE